MKPKPITLRAHEVRALLETGTVLVVRAMKPQPKKAMAGQWCWNPHWGKKSAWAKAYPDVFIHPNLDEKYYPNARLQHAKTCTFGGKGSPVWIRETWSFSERDDGMSCIRYKADGAEIPWPETPPNPPPTHRPYLWDAYPFPGDPFRCWMSPVCMPKWCSRLSGTVSSVRAVRVQEMTEEMARKCGMPPNWCGPLDSGSGGPVWDPDAHGFLGPNLPEDPDACEEGYHRTALEAFAEHWNHHNPATTWDANPWAWAVEVRKDEFNDGN